MTAQIAQVGPKGVEHMFVTHQPTQLVQVKLQFTPRGSEISSAFCGSYILHLVKFFTNMVHFHVLWYFNLFSG